ncbi:MAG: hypothetical protein PHD01_07520 [Geobacteraceae bacterium]|nr:hypothetical protein [Geobacteraceae bacterium]
MPTQKIAGATLTDIENALINQFGNMHIKELCRLEDVIKWRVNLSGHWWLYSGQCVASKSDDGAIITMSTNIPASWWVIQGIGYLACIFPGIFLTINFVIIYIILSFKIKNRFPSVVTAVQNIMINRANDNSSLNKNP